MKDYRINKIEAAYNPEMDMPQGLQPQVTWVDMALLELVKELDTKVERLENKLADREQSINIQIHGEPILTEDEIFCAALLNPTPDICPDCGCDDVGLWICYACGHQFEQPDNISPTALGLQPEA